MLPYSKNYPFLLKNLISSRQTIVEQNDVLEDRTDMNRETLDYSMENQYYRFRYTDTTVHCGHRHPQLRNLVYATSKNDVYYQYNNSVNYWSPQLRTSQIILGDPLKTPHAQVPSHIVTMAAMDEYIMAGGEDGAYTFLNLNNYKNPVFGTFTSSMRFEVNSIEMSYSRSGAPHAFVSTNNEYVRCIDLTTLRPKAMFHTSWFANYTSQSPDGHMIGVVGDSPEGLIYSTNSHEKIAKLEGHDYFSFSVAWSPDSSMVATGGDDKKTCIYDTRNLSVPVHILGTEIVDSVRALRYSSCGRYLVMAEGRDFVHIVDTTTDYQKAQKIDIVGDISGISLTPDGESLFVGVSKVEFSSLLEFERVHQSYGALTDDDPDNLTGFF
ncbi:hypothetical protein BGW38_006424 [Lunasporangiospora selenospora]|uniref:Uncharacterized protein n=1 Tax=Lunasporangiospora selenospora TaxID=979761 RepID=A0A9P6G188_9FUNG|nr:hypothetical protein BGW38_006424 [Lunasporangiospora selenospora]